MARKKVSMAYIANNSSRRTTFKKRTQGLMKKVREISTLCGVEACAIVYGPDGAQPEALWPPSVDDVVSVLARFKSMPEIEQGRKMMDRDGFLFRQVTKLEDHLRRLQRHNREAGASLVIRRCLGGRSVRDFVGTLGEAGDLDFAVRMKMQSVQQRIHALTTVGSSSSDMFVVAREENDVVVNPVDYGAMVELPDLQVEPNWQPMFNGAGGSNWHCNNVYQPYNWSDSMMGFGSEEFMHHLIASYDPTTSSLYPY